MTDQVESILHDKPDPDEAWINHPAVPKEGTKARRAVTMAMRGEPYDRIIEETGASRNYIYNMLSACRAKGLSVPRYDRTGEPAKEHKAEKRQQAATPPARTTDSRPTKKPGKPVRAQGHYVIVEAMLDVLATEPKNETQAAGLFYAAQALARHAKGGIIGDG